MPREMTPALLELVAERFKVLSDPARLRILSALRPGELTVTALVEETGLSQANTSKHLALLHTLGFVRRRRDGLHVHYALADRDIFRLCELMCGRIEREATRRVEVLEG